MPGLLQQDEKQGQTRRDMEDRQGSPESFLACRIVQTDLPTLLQEWISAGDGGEWLKILSAQVCAGLKKEKKNTHCPTQLFE